MACTHGFTEICSNNKGSEKAGLGYLAIKVKNLPFLDLMRDNLLQNNFSRIQSELP